MPKITFIRHAEPDAEGNLTPHGKELAGKIKLPNAERRLASYLPRSFQTIQAMPDSSPYLLLMGLNEWQKPSESEEEFKLRVEYHLGLLLLEKTHNTVVIGHSRWMNLAYWLLKGKPTLGFDYLEGFEHEF